MMGLFAFGIEHDSFIGIIYDPKKFFVRITFYFILIFYFIKHISLFPYTQNIFSFPIPGSKIYFKKPGGKVPVYVLKIILIFGIGCGQF